MNANDKSGITPEPASKRDRELIASRRHGNVFDQRKEREFLAHTQEQARREWMKERADMAADADAVVRVGELMLAAGTGSYRVIRGMKRTARSLGFDRFDASISLNSITFTAHRNHNFRTEVTTIRQPGVDASRIEALEVFTHSLPSHVTESWIHEQLDEIEGHTGHRWGRLVLSVAAGVACAAFALLNHFPVVSAGAVAVGAAVGQLVRSTMGKRRFNQMGTTAISAVVACVIFWLMMLALTAFNLEVVTSSPYVQAGYVASVLFLIPGFPLFTSLLDLARLDMTAGIERLNYALGLIVSATMSVWIVSMFTGLNPEFVNPPTHDWPWLFVAAGASVCGIAGFAFLFNSSRRMVLVAAIVGGVANVAKFALVFFGLPSQVAGLIGGLIIGLLAAGVNDKVNLPRITITVPASVIMIPGTSIYRAMYYFNGEEISEALGQTTAAALQVLAIAGGLMIARLLTDRAWATNEHIDLSHPRDHVNDGLHRRTGWIRRSPRIAKNPGSTALEAIERDQTRSHHVSNHGHTQNPDHNK